MKARRAQEKTEETEKTQLRAALQTLYDETADYIRINRLGDVHHNRSMQMARAALKISVPSVASCSTPGPDETAEYCQEAGPFRTETSTGPIWAVLAGNGEQIACADDEDIAYYIATALNRQRKSS